MLGETNKRGLKWVDWDPLKLVDGEREGVKLEGEQGEGGGRRESEPVRGQMNEAWVTS